VFKVIPDIINRHLYWATLLQNAMIT